MAVGVARLCSAVRVGGFAHSTSCRTDSGRVVLAWNYVLPLKGNL